MLPLTSRDRLQVNTGVCEAPADFLCRSGCTCRTPHCVLRPEAFHPQASRALDCGLWSCLLLPLIPPLPSSSYTQLLERASPDTAFILALPRALVGLCLTNPGISSFSCCFVNSDSLCSVCNLFWFPWLQFWSLFLILTFIHLSTWSGLCSLPCSYIFFL